ncbi:hypothetical protein BO86DRAFT_137720 [Aspergillus japonicus CBS 114.51]|uniref:C2H2-type domain-containing protein n=2 Tax=Aspergillus TaxID=5052 RepID=A0A2V5H3C7_ASPV1|nr:hypothetical protein BO86DRAFT_137720 [Aspergillus japonicus CBS 114.51]PYI18479.1 hypothetical protein BO99DRAFT_167100 [Aspergillus violaceofuscus CBS 115571]RAH85959.1 hypothetical protein BO86DRAFT_137720 [Aspergillus japonicus CBS 114.51]
MLSKGIHHSPGYPHFYYRQLSGSCARRWNLPSSSSPSSPSDLAKLDDFRRPRSVAPQSTAAPTPAISAWSAGIPHPGSAYNAPGSLRSSISTNEGQHNLPVLHTIPSIGRTPFPSELVPPDSEPRGLPATGLLRSRNPEQASFDTPRALRDSSQSMHPGSVAYLTSNMAHNSQNYGWQNRLPQPLHPSSMSMDQHPFPPAQVLPPHPGYSAGYPPQPSGSQGYYQPGLPSAQYLMPQSRQQPRSTSMPYSYPSSSVSGSPPSIPDPAFAPAPSSYLANQPDYYMAPSSSLSRQTPNSIPHPQGLMPTGTVYSSPESAQNSSDPEQQVRVISFRPKPQCWDHGCNGREFSTFSNLLRHQREKSGVVAKAECPSCGAVFTRTTARNIHVAQGKCKGIAREPSAE